MSYNPDAEPIYRRLELRQIGLMVVAWLGFLVLLRTVVL